MDTNNWRPPTSMDAGDRSSDQLPPGSRGLIVNKIMDTLKRDLPVPGQEELHLLKQIAIRLEEKIYTCATSQSDYLEQISLKLFSLETKSRNKMAGSSQSNSAGNFGMQPRDQGQSLSMPLSATQSEAHRQISSQNIQKNISPAGVQNSAVLSSALPPSGLSQTPGPNMQNTSGTLHNSLEKQIQGRQQSAIQQSKQSMPQQHIQSVIRQKQQEHGVRLSQSALPETSSNSAAQSGHATGGDWQEEVNQKIKVMKEMYLPELTEMYHKISTVQQSEQLDKLNTMLKLLISILHIPKCSISLALKDKLISYEKLMLTFVNRNRSGKPMCSLQQGQLHPPHIHSMQQSHCQITQVKPHENQMNSQSQSMNLQGSVATMQHMMNPLQPSSSMHSGQGNALNSLQQVVVGSTQQTPINNPHQVTQLHQNSDGDLKMRQGIGVKSGDVQQHLSGGQRAYPHQQRKSRSPIPISSTTQVLQATQVPSPIPKDLEKPYSFSNAKNIGQAQVTGIGAQVHSLAISNPEISASPFLAEFSAPDGIHFNALSTIPDKSSDTVQPLERLIKVVKSMSPNTLSAAVSDIGSVVSMTDRIAGSVPDNGSRGAVGKDLVAMTSCHMKARNVWSHDGTNGTSKRRRSTSTKPLNFLSSACSMNNSFKQLSSSDISELESIATSHIKRPRIEANQALLEEIREIRRWFIDTVVDISDEDVDPSVAAAEGVEGTILKCSFDAVSLSPNLKSQYALSPIQPLRLLVPPDYPNCSPILLDKFPVEVSKEYEEDLSCEAKSRFSRSLRNISLSTSLEEIARTWDVCAHAVISEHAEQSGGGSFSSKYGTWENCLSAV